MEQLKLSSRLALKRLKLKIQFYTVCFCFVCRLETAMEQHKLSSRLALKRLKLKIQFYTVYFCFVC
jgi:hypothetical protein